MSTIASLGKRLLLPLCLIAAGALFAHQRCWPFGTGCVFERTPPDFKTYAKDKAWAEKVRQGGYILHFRHAQREKWHDVTGFDAIELINRQDGEKTSYKRAVCLSDRGVEEAKLIGTAFKLVDIKVERVISSPSCRARQTAMLAFGSIDAVRNSLLHRTAVMVDQHKEFAADLRRLIDGLAPKAGSNIVLSGHGGTFVFDKSLVIDANETGGDLDDREETGFVVLEKSNGKVIARHKFQSIRNFVNAAVKLPLNQERLARE